MLQPDVYTNQTNLLIAAVVYLLICFLVAWIFGRPRKIGFIWSFLFSICFTPIAGYLMTIYSSKSVENIKR